MSRSGIVNVRMVITEEKILSNIEKVHKMINPKSKKQIIQLDDDTYFKDLVEAIKTYLVEYPKKQNFPASVYNAAFNLVEFATSQFEDNTKQIESLIRQRELNISLGGKLKELLKKVETKEKNWKEAVKEAQDDFEEDIINTLLIKGRSRSKETADALKEIPAPAEEVVEEQVEPIVEPIQKAKKVKAKKEKKVNVAAIAEPSNVEKVEQPKVETIQKVEEPQEEQYVSETFEAKPSLWQRFKNSKFVRTIKYIMSIRVVLEVPALPEGKSEN